ncbi:Eco57I restriction-modification methylase domain-containing protein [Vogesella fluminis]|uniref:Eco57I restriction-modification methylase domain-containing protein n=1 Tax=Vogesella fluminis TaxID=1069161 RepID=UPI0036405EF7
MRHVLCFGDLKAVGQITLDERLFPIGFVAGEGRVPVVFAAHDQGLDRPSTLHGDGTRRRSPFLLAQEYLNASEGVLWAVVSNGLKIRILRDNPSLTRPAYIEADLEAIFGEGLYPDFTALWLLAHASRFGKAGSESVDCPLERWRNTAQEDGIRARDRLRIGVTEALRALGTGFLAHSANTELRHRLEAGELTTQAYFEQLLRLVYRFIFLATIEDRELVFAPDASAEAKARYLTGYSLTRLRQLAARRRSYDRHADLWQALTITFSSLGKGQPALGLPALGGLFTAGQCPDLDAAQLDNAALLSALFSLCFFRDGAALSRVNYRDMDSEELGSVYESLLELVPQVTLTAGARRFGFIGDEEEGSTKGNARKLTGSYYTPDSLVQELIKSALEPVIERTLAENPQEPVKALLSLSVCDPACGSGHFLLAAARRIAEEVARLNVADGNPLPADFRRALRDVVAHCIYGVDKNSMAVELARTALWLEAYTPERPLTFLDAHLRCGDALLGVLDPAILTTGIPDKAFNALSGDDKEVVKRLKKANRDALKAIAKAQVPSGQFSLGLQTEADAAAFESLPDDTLEAVEAKRAAYATILARMADSHARLAADLFVATFVQPKTPENEPHVPTSQDLWLVQNGSSPRPGVADAAHRAAEAAQAFHWWQAFPQIQAKGGFDVLLGNPPWERIKLQEEEFFASRSPLIAEAPHKAERGRRIALLAEGMLLHSLYPEVEAAQGLVPPNAAEHALYAEFLDAKRGAEAASLFAHDAGRYPLTGVGDVNTYALFAETFAQLVSAQGRAGFIVPTGIATDDSTKAYFAALTQNSRLVSLYDIENRDRLFPAVDSRMKFCLITLGIAPEAEFVCFATQVTQLTDQRRRFRLVPEEFALVNPNTLTCPVFRSERDAELTKKLYRNSIVLKSREGSFELGRIGWNITLRTMFHKSGDSALFVESEVSKEEMPHLPLFEGGLGHQFNCRYSEFRDGHEIESDYSQLADPGYFPLTEWSVQRSDFEKKCESMRLSELARCRSAFLGFRRVARNTDERTVIACIFPWMPSTYGWILTFGVDAKQMAVLCGVYNSLVFDYLLRTSLSQPSIPQGTFEQVALPPRTATPMPTSPSLFLVCWNSPTPPTI